MKYLSTFLIILCFAGLKISVASYEAANKCVANNSKKKNNTMSIEEILYTKSILDTLQISMSGITRRNDSVMLANARNNKDGYEIVMYSKLLDVDYSLLNSIFPSDSLFEIFIYELDKLPINNELTHLLTDGLLECDLLTFPETLYKSFSLKEQLKLQSRYCNDKFFNVSNYIFDINYSAFISVSGANCGADTIMMEYSIPAIERYFKRNIFCVSPAVANACSLHFSSETLPSGEQIILINGTAYRIIRREDGSRVLRKAE